MGIMLTAFYPLEKRDFSLEYIRLMAQAGITNLQLNYCMDIANEADNRLILQQAEKCGLGVTVCEKRWGRGGLARMTDERLAEEILKYAESPAVIGYYLFDEPTPEEQLALYPCFEKIHGLAPGKDIHINFLPDMIGMEELARAVHPHLGYLMLDLYVYPAQGGILEEDMFAASDRLRRLGLKLNIPTAQYVECCAWGKPDLPRRRKPTAGELAYHVHAVTAYGAKQIAYFPWRRPEDETYIFGEAVMTEEGRPTELYFAIKKINRRLLSWSDELMALDAVEVCQTGEVCEGCRALPDDAPLHAASSQARGLIISRMRERSGARDRWMLVNRDTAQTARVLAEASMGAPLQMLDDHGTWQTLAKPLELEPGGCALLRIMN